MYKFNTNLVFFKFNKTLNKKPIQLEVMGIIG
jgi:hypothetical protein